MSFLMLSGNNLKNQSAASSDQLAEYVIKDPQQNLSWGERKKFSNMRKEFLTLSKMKLN